VEAEPSPAQKWNGACACGSCDSEFAQYALGLSVAGLSIDDRAEAFSEVVKGFGSRFGLLDIDVDLTLQACAAAFDASGRVLSELGSFPDDDGLLSLPGRNVRFILPLFSGDGVRACLSSVLLGASVDALLVCGKALSRIDPVPELFRGAIAGRYGSGGGLERSAYSIGGIDPSPIHVEDPLVSFGV
jgi:hypothetical protein